MEIKSIIESLLFVSSKPMSPKQLSDIIKVDIDKIKKAGDELVKDYQEKKCGIMIIKDSAKFLMVSSPVNTEYVQVFVKDETTGELSKPSLETLTIIAYRGPITKVELNKIRGVNCALILKNLLIRGLIMEIEGAETGEVSYEVTLDFVKYLGVSDVRELPDFEKLSTDTLINKVLEDKE